MKRNTGDKLLAVLWGLVALALFVGYLMGKAELASDVTLAMFIGLCMAVAHLLWRQQ